jgi:hypothetical protein
MVLSLMPVDYPFTTHGFESILISIGGVVPTVVDKLAQRIQWPDNDASLWGVTQWDGNISVFDFTMQLHDTVLLVGTTVIF